MTPYKWIQGQERCLMTQISSCLFIDDNCVTQRAADGGGGGGGMCIDKTVWDNIRVSCYDIDLIVSACVRSFHQPGNI